MVRLGRMIAGAGLAVTVAHAATAGVLVVDDNGGAGVTHTQISAAVAAALDNDLILVKSGTYAGFSVNNKALVITADLGHVVLADQVGVSNLAASKSVTISGITISGNSGGIGLDMAANMGPILIERCSISGSGIPIFQINTGMRVSNCQNVTLSLCSVSVASGSGTYNGLDAFNSSVHVYESTIQGGHGDPVITAGFPGGNGMQLSGGFLFASGSSFTGGNGGPGTITSPFMLCTNGGPGGHGLVMGSTPAPNAKIVDCTFAGGAGGAPGGPACTAGAPGQGTVVNSGSIATFPYAARTYDIPSPVREGQTGFISLAGDPGEFVWIFLSFTHAPAYSDLWKGTLLPGAPQLVFFIGALPPSGTVTFNVPVPINPATVSGALYEQALYYTAAKGFVASNPRLGVVLDQTL